ncbi:MAG: thioredoxin [Thermoleophilia bacterium]|nr:thioredoxin [Thermoleophilia bacterium]
MAATVVTCLSCGKRARVRPHATAIPRCAGCHAPLPWSVEADEADFAEETRAAVPVVVDLWAPWCGPCRQIAPVLERLAERHAGRLKVVRVNIDDNPGLAQRHQAMSIPLLVVMRDGREVDRIVGAMPAPALERRLAPYLGPASG